jgi:hypothetical protein
MFSSHQSAIDIVGDSIKKNFFETVKICIPSVQKKYNEINLVVNKNDIRRIGWSKT